MGPKYWWTHNCLITTDTSAYFTISYFGYNRLHSSNKENWEKSRWSCLTWYEYKKGNIAKEGFELALEYDNVFSCNFYTALETQIIFIFPDQCLVFNVTDYEKWYLEFLLAIVQKCKCDFCVLYVRYSLMWPGIPKLGWILRRVRHLFSLWTV